MNLNLLIVYIYVYIYIYTHIYTPGRGSKQTFREYPIKSEHCLSLEERKGELQKSEVLT